MALRVAMQTARTLAHSPLPTGEYGACSKVEIVHSTSANAIIPKMDRIFSTYGMPLVIKSDNGP